MELVSIRVSVSGGSAAIAELEKIKGLISNINTAPVKIEIQTVGDAKALQAHAKLEAATAKRIASENKLAIEVEKSKQSVEKTATEEAKLAVQQEKTATTSERVKVAAENRAAAEARAQSATKELGAETEKTAKKAESLLDNFQKFARWYLVGNVITSIIRDFREALQTMKAVDDELVTIRKVTDFSPQKVEGIRETAYEKASYYGVAANDYLNSAAQFARAGYKDQIEALAELSTKTQIVGDVTAETANQFLLSVDAAYKYKGEISKLNAVLDGANEIDNKYATSISKISEGLGIVAPVAAQLGVGIDQLTAMLGTITAVTQRSGSEAARALRSILINLTSDINATFTDVNGEITYAIGEIDGLSDVVKNYAADLYNTAQETGKILNPTEVLEALVRAADEGRLTEQKLYDLVTDESGKLRAAQLWALIQNWDTMYKSMLNDYAGAVGSADKEVENALDSWSRKTARLQNTWTQFVSHLADSGAIKAGLDVLTGFVSALDSGFTKFALTMGGVAAAVALATQLIDKFKASGIGKALGLEVVKKEVEGIGAAAVVTAFKTEGLAAGLKSLWATLSVSPVFWVTAAAAAIYGIVTLYDALNVTATEHLENARQEMDAYQQITSELDTMRDKIAANNAEIERANALGGNDAYVSRLESENRLLQSQIDLQAEAAQLHRDNAAKEARAALTSESDVNFSGYDGYDSALHDYVRRAFSVNSGLVAGEEAMPKAPDELLTLMHKGSARDLIEDAEYLIRLAGIGIDTAEDLSRILGQINDSYDLMRDSSSGVTEEETARLDGLMDIYREFYPVAEKATEATEQFGQSFDGAAAETEKFQRKAEVSREITAALTEESRKGADSYDALKSKLDPLQNAYKEMAESGSMTESTWKALLEATDGLSVGIDGTTESGEDFDKILLALIDDVLEAARYTADFADDATDAGVKMRDFAEATKDAGSGADALLNTAKPAFQAVTQAMDEMKGGGELSLETLTELESRFQNVQGIDGYVSRLLNVKSSGEDVAEILSELAYAYATTREGSESLSGASQSLIETMLREAGVENAAAVAADLVTLALGRQRLGTDGMAEATYRAVGAMSAEEAEAFKAAYAVAQVTAANLGVNQNQINLNNSIGALSGLAASSAGASYAVQALLSVLSRLAKMDASVSAGVAAEQAAIDNLVEGMTYNAVAHAKQHNANLAARLENVDIMGMFNQELAKATAGASFSGGYAPPTITTGGGGSGGGGGGGSGGGGSGGSGEDPRIKALKAEIQHRKDNIALLKSELSLLEEQAKAGDGIYDAYAKALQEAAALGQELHLGEPDTSADNAQIAKYREIQAALHEEAEYLRSIQAAWDDIGVSQADVNALSLEWLQLDQKIQDIREKQQKSQLQAHKDAVSALKNQLEFLEAADASEEERIEKLRAIQNALHYQADYLRSIEADEEDIRDLQTEWLKLNKQIAELTEQIAQTLRDEVSDALETIADSLKDAADAASGPLKEELAALKAAHDATEARREEEEKILAVTQARIALENAQKERTVRVYNRETDQWEWQADAKAVQAAKKSLSDAEDALKEFRENQAYEAAVDALEKQIEDTGSAFDAFREAIEHAAEAIRNGEMAFDEAYAYIRDAMHRIYDEYGVDLSGVMGDVTALLEEQFGRPLRALSDMEWEIQRAIDAIKERSGDPAAAIDEFARAIYLALETDDPAAAIDALVRRILDGADQFNDIDTLLADINDETNRILLIAKMRRNSAEWLVAGDERRTELHDENMRIGTALGWDYDPQSGLWYTDSSHNQVAYTVGENSAGAASPTMYGDDFFAALAETLERVLQLALEQGDEEPAPETGGGSGGSSGGSAGGNSGGRTPEQRADIAEMKRNSKEWLTADKDRREWLANRNLEIGAKWGWYRDENGVWYDEYGVRLYDRGGILHGIGGIKATKEDEMILPPDITRALLTTQRSGGFDALLRNLGIVTAAGSQAGLFGLQGAERIRIEHHQYNGNVYNINGTQIGEERARTATISDFVGLFETLPLYGGR